MGDAGLETVQPQPRARAAAGATESKVVEVQLPNGTTMGVLVATEPGGTDVGLFDKKDKVYDINDLSKTLDGFAELLKSIWDKAGPTKATIEVGFEIAVKSGKLTAILVEGSGTASMKVTMEWGS